MKQHFTLTALCQSALLAALYAALTLALPMLSFNMMQLRFSEALTVLPVLHPPAVLGLTAGCMLSNLVGFLTGANPIGLIDAAVGSTATLLAGLCSAAVGRLLPAEGRPHLRLLLGLLPPVVFNAFMVGAELSLLFSAPFRLSAFWVAAGELAVCLLLGYPLGLALQRGELWRRIFRGGGTHD